MLQVYMNDVLSELENGKTMIQEAYSYDDEVNETDDENYLCGRK